MFKNNLKFLPLFPRGGSLIQRIVDGLGSRQRTINIGILTLIS